MFSLFLAIELVLTCIAVAAAYAAPHAAAQWLRKAEQILQPLVKRRGLAVLVIGVMGLMARAAILPVLPVPDPSVHDEFSYLLAADTFAHGRVTNPAHPMWMHFESFHINQKPTYQSMYYPGQGLLLAAGQVFFGHPFAGIWLSAGLMCAAICWMLQGWMPAKWALLGGFLAVIRIGTFSYWANSYYGGALTALGGALVLGALPRIQRQRRITHAMLLAAGLAILANTRPFESFFFGIPVAIVLFAWMFGGRGPTLQVSIRRIILPITLILALTIVGMGYYFWRVTGSPFRVPYQVSVETYGLLYFPWQHRFTPEFHHAPMRDFYVQYILGPYEEALSHPYEKVGLSFLVPWLFFVGPVFTLPFATWVAGGGFVSRKTRFFVAVCLFTSVGLLLPIFIAQPHYAAALTCVIYALLLQAMRHARLWRWNKQPSGDMIVLAIPLICVVLFALRIAIAADGHALTSRAQREEFHRTWASPRLSNIDRAAMLRELAAKSGRHLAIVHYEPNHDVVLNEWVYNDADIDNAKVVWARQMSPEEDEKLIHYFKDRQVWLAEPDETPPRLSVYPESR